MSRSPADSTNRSLAALGKLQHIPARCSPAPNLLAQVYRRNQLQIQITGFTPSVGLASRQSSPRRIWSARDGIE